VTVRRIGPYRGVYRLYDPRRRTLSVRLWFDQGQAERAAKRWVWGMFEIKPNEIIEP